MWELDVLPLRRYSVTLVPEPIEKALLYLSISLRPWINASEDD